MPLARSGFSLKRKGGAQRRGRVRDPHLAHPQSRISLRPDPPFSPPGPDSGSCFLPRAYRRAQDARSPCLVDQPSLIVAREVALAPRASSRRPQSPQPDCFRSSGKLVPPPGLSPFDCPPRMVWKLEPAPNSWVCLRELFSGEEAPALPPQPHTNFGKMREGNICQA